MADDQQIDAQTVARVPHRESEAVAAGDHLGGDHHEPRQSGGDAQRGDHLRGDGRQRDAAQQRAVPLMPRSRATRKYTLGMFATAARRRKHDREERRHEDQEDRRRIADAEPEDRERNPRERREASEEVDDAADRPRARAPSVPAAGPPAAPRTTASRNPARDAEQRRDRIGREPSAAQLEPPRRGPRPRDAERARAERAAPTPPPPTPRRARRASRSRAAVL